MRPRRPVAPNLERKDRCFIRKLLAGVVGIVLREVVGAKDTVGHVKRLASLRGTADGCQRWLSGGFLVERRFLPRCRVVIKEHLDLGDLSRSGIPRNDSVERVANLLALCDPLVPQKIACQNERLLADKGRVKHEERLRGYCSLVALAGYERLRDGIKRRQRPRYFAPQLR